MKQKENTEHTVICRKKFSSQKKRRTKNKQSKNTKHFFMEERDPFFGGVSWQKRQGKSQKYTGTGRNRKKSVFLLGEW